VCTHECMRLTGVPDLEVLGRVHEPLSSILLSNPMVTCRTTVGAGGRSLDKLGTRLA
jgi:hypothetical protein